MTHENTAEDEEEEDGYYLFGELSLPEAQKFLPQLEEAKIRFQIDPTFRDAGRRRRFGTSHKIELYIHRDDEDSFRRISQVLFKDERG